jgi:hypothetical protein
MLLFFIVTLHHTGKESMYHITSHFLQVQNYKIIGYTSYTLCHSVLCRQKTVLLDNV